MKKTIHPSLIGAFILGALALATIGVLVIGSGRLFQQSDRFVLHFSGSVKGLDVGAPVQLKGVTVGQVAGINLEYNPTDKVFYTQVFIDVPQDAVRRIGAAQNDMSDKPSLATAIGIDTLIESGLRAKLELQSFVTGKLLVAFDFYPDSPAVLTAFNDEYRELPTLPSEMEALAKTFDSIDFQAVAESIGSAAEGIVRLVNSTDVHAAAASLHDTLTRYGQLASALERRIGELTDDMTLTLADIRRLIQHADGQVAPMAQEITATAADIRRSAARLEARLIPLANTIEATGVSARDAFQEAQNVLSNLDRLSDTDSTLIYRLDETLEEMRTAARALTALVNFLSRHPEALIQGKREAE